MGEIYGTRWDYHPITAHGRAMVIKALTDDDYAKLEALVPNRTLSARFVAYLLNKDYRSTQKRFKELAAEPNRYVDLYNHRKSDGEDSTQETYIGLYGDQWFSLNKNGADSLRETGRDIQILGEGNPIQF